MSGCFRRITIFIIDLVVIALLIIVGFLIYDHYYGIQTLPVVFQPLSTFSISISRTQTPISTPLPQATPTPGLFSGSAQSYLPVLEELPDGFDLLSEGKAVVPLPDLTTPMADQSEQYDSYQKEFLAADLSKIGEVLSLRFLIFIYPSESQAADGYRYLDLEHRLAGMQVDQERLENIQEQALFFDLDENMPNPETPQAACIAVFRKRNALVTIMASGLLSSDHEISKRNLISDCTYYANLIDGKLK